MYSLEASHSVKDQVPFSYSSETFAYIDHNKSKTLAFFFPPPPTRDSYIYDHNVIYISGGKIGEICQQLHKSSVMLILGLLYVVYSAACTGNVQPSQQRVISTCCFALIKGPFLCPNNFVSFCNTYAFIFVYVC